MNPRPDLKYPALIVSVAAVFSLRFFRDFDLSPVEQDFAARRSAAQTPLAADLLYLFFETFGFVVERDWFYFTGYTVAGFAALSLALLGVYALLRRRYARESAAAGALGLAATLPVPVVLLFSLRILLRSV